MSEDEATVVAVNCRRWWMNSARVMHVAFPNRYFDQLGVPRLATQPQLPEPPGADPHAGWCGRGRSSGVEAGVVTSPKPEVFDNAKDQTRRRAK